MTWEAAVQRNDVELVARALADGIAVDEVAAGLWSATSEMLELLFAHGLDPNAAVANPWDATELVPIPFAVFDGGRWSVDVLEMLVANGFDPWAEHHSRSLLTAVCGGVCQSFDRPNVYPVAEQDRFFAMAVAMLDGRSLREAPFEAAAWWGELRWVELLLDTGAKPGPHAVAPWVVKSADAVRLLLRHGADPDGTSGDRPLIRAAEIGDFEIARMLMDAGADPRLSAEYGGRDAIGVASRNGHRELADWLRGDGGTTPYELVCAAQDGELDEVLRMLSEGADPNEPDGAGRLPITVAATYGRVEVVAALLEHRADPRALAKPGYDALRAAALADQPAAAALLLQRVGLHHPDAYITALGAAVWGRSIGCIELFLGAGADPNGPFSPMIGMLRTPILATAELANFGDWDAPRAFRMLLDAGADPTIPGDRSWTCRRLLEAAQSSPRVEAILAMLDAED